MVTSFFRKNLEFTGLNHIRGFRRITFFTQKLPLRELGGSYASDQFADLVGGELRKQWNLAEKLNQWMGHTFLWIALHLRDGSISKIAVRPEHFHTS